MNSAKVARSLPPIIPVDVGDILDLDHLARQTLHDSELEREVISMFFEQSAQALRQIRNAAGHGQRIEAAHKLKGSARAVGAFRVAEASDRLESLPPGADEGQLLDAIAGLHATVAEARAAIAGLLDPSGPGGL